MNRRDFMRTIAAAGATTLLKPASIHAEKAMASLQYFGLHEFIETHPEAVFIKHTHVSVKTDSEAKRQEGADLAREIFALRNTPGIPLSHRIAIKPNLTCVGWAGVLPTSEEGMGIITDCDFVEGMIEGMKEVGIPADKMYMREGNWLGDSYCPSDCLISPYIDMAERTGVHLVDFPTGRTITELTLETLEEGSEVIWKYCPGGVVFERIGYVAPFNQPDTWLLNISKFKAHHYGMTLCVKNLQGMCIHPHVHFCEGITYTKQSPAYILSDFQPDFEEHVEQLYAQHLAAGIPRWDRDMEGRGRYSGYALEVWAQRTCDSLSVTNTGLNIIEGIYGRNGNTTTKGPGPGGKAQDFMTNVLLFGKDPFRVDTIGCWLSGHEPVNFGLFHIARERGLCDTINPMAIPVYLWDNGIPIPTSLEDFERTPLVSPYLRQDYGGSSEPEYHLVNEPCYYEEAPSFLSIPLEVGWNLISIPIRLLNNALDVALQAIAGYYTCVLTYDAADGKWKCYTVSGPGFLNDLEAIDPEKGYWIQMVDPAVLTLYGDGITNEAIQLKRGWNLVAYGCSPAKPIEEALASIVEKCNSVWTFDAADAEWKRYVVNGPEDSNNLRKMKLGRGYWLNVVDECIWIAA